ncbi:hypothetical protein DDL81_22975 [Escherichia coli]|nr:hypothetical protein [Escherichia coli]RRL32544.1 hypothetical protein DU324_03515 [Escherichia coli]RRL32799.1 hypothetical protein DU325_04845 [Escherichia coli]
MSNLATVTHLRPSQRPVERRVAEVEDGYTRLTGQANAGQTYANNASQLYQQQAAAVAANANRPSTGQKLIGGIGSGAAIGGSVGGPWGAAIGAGVGALGSLLY